MHDLAPGRSATAVGRRCGCARARYAAVQSSVAQLTAACAGPALGCTTNRKYLTVNSWNSLEDGIKHVNSPNHPILRGHSIRRALYIYGSSHKCMHDLAPGRSATAVGRRCGCARARYAAVQSSVAQLTAACAGPALGGGPARRQPDQTQAADSMALTWPRTVKASGTRPRLSPMFCAGAERSLTVQPPWNWQPRHDSGVCCGRTFREPATPLQIQTVFFSHVSH